VTNKKDAAKQIGKRVRRMEMAEQALHRRKLRKRQHSLLSVSRAPSESTDANMTDAADDSDLRYFISPSQNHKIDIYQLLRTRNGDPAYKVSVKASHARITLFNWCQYRHFYRNSKITSSDGCLGEILMATHMDHSHRMTDKLYKSYPERCIQYRRAVFTTLPMTSKGRQIQSTPGLVPM
jgi:hypothetical protein